MSVEVYREWPDGSTTRRPPPPWPYFRRSRRAKDPSTRHDPATAISDDVRWYHFIEEPISAIVVPLFLALAGLIRIACHYALALLRIMVNRRSVIMVERDGQAAERHEVVGRMEGVRVVHQLRSRHRAPSYDDAQSS